MTNLTPRNYIMIGAGGTGSMLFGPLLRLLETTEKNEGKPFRLVVVDGRAVRPANLERQMFNIHHVSENKAQALVGQYGENNRIIAVPRYLKADDTMLANGDVILIAADNWPVRRHIEARALDLKDITIINGGNELSDGSMQIWIRRNGENLTPPLSQGHPEILNDASPDMAELSCAQIAELPGGGQTITANMMSAVAMLNAVNHLFEWEASGTPWNYRWNEVFFDLKTYAMRGATR